MSLFNKDQPASSVSPTARPGTMSSAALLKSESIPQKPHSEDAEANQTVNDANFSDLYIAPDKKCYVWSHKSSNGLKLANYIDLGEFINAVVAGYNGSLSSYSLNFKNRSYRVERTVALEGEQFCARKMPIHIPDLEKLNLPAGVYRQLISLANKTGLILLTGATGSGKSTTISALIKKYLTSEGGYAFTIEDPIEMPLDGVYQTRHGDLGLCKQTMPPNGKWADGIKSALRSKPRYIYVGEIRSPEAAVELLRAATSGHLVFSTIHGNNVTDAINALAKYAASSGISEDMSYEMIANGFLCCVHQTLSGTPHRLQVEAVFSNPNLSGGCAVRAMIRTGRLNLGSIIEQQQSKMNLGRPLFDE